jgi:hypothetical protein
MGLPLDVRASSSVDKAEKLSRVWGVVVGDVFFGIYLDSRLCIDI